MNLTTDRKMECINVAERLPALAPQTDWHAAGKCDHFVQFYDSDSFLIDSVAGFFVDGLQAGEAAIVIATPAHRDALAAALASRGVEIGSVISSGQYLALDAKEMLDRFMVRGSPDWKLFNDSIGDVVRQALRAGRRLRAFGEMVALLWEDGQGPAAIQLEVLWNDLAKDHSFTLFCAYPTRAFRQAADGISLAHICEAHTRVIPAESYTGKESWDERLRSITILQQRASALDVEVEERRRAETNSRVAQTKLDMAAAAAGLGVWDYNLVTDALETSPACKAHFGLKADEPLSYERAFALICPEDRERVRAEFSHAIAGGTAYHVEYRMVHPDGDMHWITATGRIFHNGSHHMLGVTMDTTERKRATEVLEETVASRTAQLRDSLSELEAFSYSVSHDMRAPLRAMQGYAKAVIDDFGSKLDPEAADNLRRIQRAAVRLDSLIRDVLAYSKIAKGTIEVTPVSLQQIVDDIISQHPENLRPCITAERPLHGVEGHEACLTQCLSNFISNALKFTPPGVPPTVRIRSELIQGKVKVSVSDRGVGIHPDHYARVFQMFGRVYSEKRYEGTGMGLAIAKKAIARLGGAVGFTSDFGHGSTFWFTLPHAKTHQ